MPTEIGHNRHPLQGFNSPQRHQVRVPGPTPTTCSVPRAITPPHSPAH
nr:hypothetical protein [Acetobacter persici]